MFLSDFHLSLPILNLAYCAVLLLLEVKYLVLKQKENPPTPFFMSRFCDLRQRAVRLYPSGADGQGAGVRSSKHVIWLPATTPHTLSQRHALA
jgi:hypothetical protein